MLFFPRFGDAPNTYDALKALAIITMVADHLGAYFFPDEYAFRIIGRIAFPCFLFLVGYNHSYKNSAFLLIAATLVQISCIWNGFGVFSLNILFTILFSRMLLHWLEHNGQLERPHEILICCMVFFLPLNLFIEYGVVGFMFACLGYYARTERNDLPVKIFWLITAALWIGGQYFLSFRFPLYESWAFVSIAMVTLLILRKFELKPFASTLPQGKLLDFITLALSRNALLIYVVHIIAFQTISVYLGIHSPTFSWLGISQQ